MKVKDRRGFTLVELAAVLGIALILAAVLVPLVRWQLNSAAADMDHSQLRKASTQINTFRVLDISPVNSAELPLQGEPITFYLLQDGSFRQEGTDRAAVPARAYVLGGTEERGCTFDFFGELRAEAPDWEEMEFGTMVFCGVHKKGNHVKLVYCPCGDAGSGKWLLLLEA